MKQDNFVTWLEKSIQHNWELPALSNYNGNTLTYGQVAEKIIQLHALFEHNHIKRGDKIALLGRNSVNWALAYLAAVSYGAVIVPILPDFAGEDIHHIVNHSDSVLLFAAESHLEIISAEAMPNLYGILSLKDFTRVSHHKSRLLKIFHDLKTHLSKETKPRVTPNSFRLPEVSPEDLAAIVYTSGTTGFSKGVMLPHRSITANMRYAQNNMPLKSGDKIVSFMPLAHSYGCAFEFLFPLTLGCHITFLAKMPSPKVLIEAFDAIKPQLILSVPLIIEKIYRKQIQPALKKPVVRSLYRIPFFKKLLQKKILAKLMAVFGGRFHEVVIGGAALNAEVEAFLQEIGFPFTIGYGMTECGPLISYASWREHRPQGVGRVVDSLEIKIDSPDAENEVGEILVRGENVMTGYYKNTEATDETIDPDGWLHTGDLGTIDRDGFIYIKGRCKSMILGASGQNIYPEEVEARLNNLPFVMESVVFEKDGKLEALVYPDMELVDQHKLTETQLLHHMEQNRSQLNRTLPNYINVSKIKIFPEEFEKTPTRKIKRYRYTG